MRSWEGCLEVVRTRYEAVHMQQQSSAPLELNGLCQTMGYSAEIKAAAERVLGNVEGQDMLSSQASGLHQGACSNIQDNAETHSAQTTCMSTHACTSRRQCACDPGADV